MVLLVEAARIALKAVRRKVEKYIALTRDYTKSKWGDVVTTGNESVLMRMNEGWKLSNGSTNTYVCGRKCMTCSVRHAGPGGRTCGARLSLAPEIAAELQA